MGPQQCPAGGRWSPSSPRQWRRVLPALGPRAAAFRSGKVGLARCSQQGVEGCPLRAFVRVACRGP
eukprot:70869-Lingulodinium_polyedra.AAC.1